MCLPSHSPLLQPADGEQQAGPPATPGMRSVVACARPCPGQARCVSPGSSPLQQAAHGQGADAETEAQGEESNVGN